MVWDKRPVGMPPRAAPIRHHSMLRLSLLAVRCNCLAKVEQAKALCCCFYVRLHDDGFVVVAAV